MACTALLVVDDLHAPPFPRGGRDPAAPPARGTRLRHLVKRSLDDAGGELHGAAIRLGGRMRHAVCIVAIAALAGCGGGDGEVGSSSEDGSQALKVQETAGMPSAFVGFGIEQRIFEKHGLNVELEETQGGAATLPALLNGDVQIGGSNVVWLL